MSLSLYKKKRKFSETPEPEGKEKSSKGCLRFVIQKHDASNLHYDFRLEMKGILKSWAVPKGASINPADKRLAMMVEDHPYDYRDFEGIIPEGNYGGGTVMVWDEGTYQPEGGEELTTKEQEKLLLGKLHSGDLKIILHGKKIKGSYALVKIKRDEKSWLLIKHRDQFAGESDITQKNKSVKSGKTLAQIAEENDSELNHPEDPTSGVKISGKVATKTTTRQPVTKKSATKIKTANKNFTSGKKKGFDVKALVGENFSLTRKTKMPGNIQPMLATLVNEPFDDTDWIFEIKWDGYRALAFVGDDVQLISRNKIPFTSKYNDVAKALKSFAFAAVFDGEIVAVNEKGLSDFQLLQNWQNTPAPLQYLVFDILWFDGYDLTALPLIARKELSKKILPPDHGIIKYSDHVEGEGISFFKLAIEQGLEGIIAKRKDSLYELNRRSGDWLKIKGNLRQEVVIAGFTEPRNSRNHFGALLLGVYEGKELIYVGHTGSGFNHQSLEDVYKKLLPLVIKDCPFQKEPKVNMPATWVEPKLVCEIKFTEWTKEGVARHPIFMGLREDKKPEQVHFEKTKTISSMKERSASHSNVTKQTSKKQAAKKTVLRNKKKATPSKKTAGKIKTSGIQVNASEGDEQKVEINGHELTLTSLDKLYWKKERFTKGDSINYYLRIAPYILPYMIDRPQSLNRHPNGIDALNFFQKDMKGKLPVWMQTHIDFSESTNKEVEYLVCANEATLIYMANLGCIELHPWHSRTQSWEKPDWCLIDLDPDKKNTFDQVIQTAQVVKQVLDSIGADSYVKTSGSSGIHIYIPLAAQYNYDQSKQLAELVVTMVHQEIPEFTSLERSPAKRKGKIYLDYLQNRETQTAAAPYSLRPKRGAPVSTPLHWDEVKRGLTATDFTLKNIFERLGVEGDLFKPVLGKGINLQKVLGKLETLS